MAAIAAYSFPGAPLENQRAIIIPVGDPDNEVKIFSDIRRRWFKYRGRWQRLFPFHGKEVKVTIFKST